VTDATAATSVQLKDGEEVVGIDLVQRVTPTVRLSGRITSSGSSPFDVSMLLVAVGRLEAEDALVKRLGTVPIRQGQGSFAFSGIFPGSYVLAALGRCENGGTQTLSELPSNERDLALQRLAHAAALDGCAGVTRVAIAGSDVEGVGIALLPRVALPGRVSLDSSRTISRGEVRITLYGVEPAIPANYAVVLPADAEPDGTFEIEYIPPGRFIPEVNLYDRIQDHYVHDVLQAGVSVIYHGIEVESRKLEPLEVVLRSDGASLSGIVEDGNKRPIGDAVVVLVPQGARRQNRSLYPRTVADSEGRFTIRSIAPGEYKAYAWEHDPSESYYFQPESLSLIESYSRSFRAVPKTRISSFRLLPVP
jgi:hypothetical protein